MIKSVKPTVYLMVIALLSIGCAEVAKRASTPSSNMDLWPKLTGPLRQDAGVEASIDALLAQMTTEQKVGQLIMPELRTTTPADIRHYHIGSILNGGGSYPHGDKRAEADDWLALADRFYQASMDTRDGGIAIPIMWGTDAVHGHNNVVGATIFPHNIGLGAARNPDLVREIHAITAREVAVTGIDWNFSPSVAVARDDRWGRTYESWSENPELVRAYAGEAVTGLQGEANTESFMGSGKVIATAKHFIGDGATRNGIDRGDAQIDERELRQIHAAGYLASIAAGVQTIMASFNSWRGEKLHGHHYLLTDVLKKQIGFDGLIVGDWNGHEFVDGCTRNSCPASFNAGVDILMAPDDWKVLYTNTVAQVESGEIAMARLDDAVRRILRVKKRAGLFEKGKPSARPYANRTELLGSSEHRTVARQAVRESLVLLKNSGGLLPLARNSRVLVAGDGAHNIGKQSGGWTLTWQGTGNTREDFPNGTSIYESIAATVASAGGEAFLSEKGAFDQRPDVAIVVFGEDPYAEMQGDVNHLAYVDKTQLDLLRRLQAQDIPVVALFITGRPLWVNPFLNASDAFAVIWKPGTEGGGIADVIFRDTRGEIQYDFTGRLPFSWPKSAVQSPLNHGSKSYDPLFPYGFGLSYGDEGALADLLSEDSGVTEVDGTQALHIFHDRPLHPWRLVLTDTSRAALPVTGSSASLPAIRVQSIDRRVQEDARRVQWRGGDSARVQLVSEQRTDLTPYLRENAVLSIDVRMNRAPGDAVYLGMGCGSDCSAELEITEALAEPGEWRTLSIALSCFDTDSFDPQRVLTPFYLRTEGEMALDFHHIRLDTESEAPITCE